jgi:hypothetical protein
MKSEAFASLSRVFFVFLPSYLIETAFSNALLGEHSSLLSRQEGRGEIRESLSPFWKQKTKEQVCGQDRTTLPTPMLRREESLIIGFLFCHIISSNTRSSAKRKNYYYYYYLDHVFNLSLSQLSHASGRRHVRCS